MVRCSVFVRKIFSQLNVKDKQSCKYSIFFFYFDKVATHFRELQVSWNGRSFPFFFPFSFHLKNKINKKLVY